MGIKIEFNPDLCLRVYNSEGRLKEECIPEFLEIGNTYPFVKNHGINSVACSWFLSMLQNAFSFYPLK